MAPAGLVIPGAAMAVRLARSALRKGIQAVRDRLPEVGRQSVEPALVRSNAARVPAGRIAGHHKPHSNAYRTYASQGGARFYSTSHAVKTGGAASSIGRQVGPFVSTLRPRLCGALPRSAGGYGAGSVRHFSHNPAPQEVIRQVNQAMRAFFAKGASYNRRKGGHASYIKGQIRMQVAASQTGANAPGAYVDFRLAPVLRCFDPKNNCLDSTGLDELQSDFSTVVSDISAIFHDLRRLSTLGDLPISLEHGHILRVHFKGADYELVESLLNEVGVTRGIVHEDERFSFENLTRSVSEAVEWQDMMSSSSGSESFFFHEEGVFADLSEGTMSIPLESGEEFYDEIDPGGGLGNSSSSSNSSFIFTGHPMDGVIDMGDAEAYRNPWATPARSVTASA